MLSPGDCALPLDLRRSLRRLQHRPTLDASMHREHKPPIESAYRSVAERTPADERGVPVDMWTANSSLPTRAPPATIRRHISGGPAP